MVGDSDAGHTGPFDVVSDVLDDPSQSRADLPNLLELLDDDDREVRLAGALSVCLVAVADVDAISAVVNRLADRMDGTGRPEVVFAYEYLVSQFPERADEALQDRDGAGGTPSNDSSTAARDFDRSERVGRVRPPGVGSFDPRTTEPDRQVIDPADPQRNPDAEPRTTGSGSEAEPTPEPTGGEGRSNAVTERMQWNRLFDRLSAIVEHSRFDDLMVLSGRKRDRCAEVTRVLADDQGVERALALRVFHRPSEDVDSFEADLATALGRWQSISDHPNVVSVYTWGRQPRPWAATEPPESTLADRGGPVETEIALSLTLDLADALAYAHQRGVVHGGIDPENVTLPEAGAPSTGALDNVGLLDVYRWRVTPSSCLDPRYAAPEYYDRRFGRVNHATDVYQLGAVLYRLVTGRPPFRGPFEEIRAGVMHDTPPEPSTVADLPAALDQIVTKAMAKRALTRYETINDFRREVARVHGELTSDD